MPKKPRKKSARKSDPAALTPAELAKILTAAGGQTVSEATVRGHVEAGSPVSAGGRINLVHYVAWLIREMQRRIEAAPEGPDGSQ